MFVYEGVESIEVTGFLVVHVFHQRSEVRMLADDGWCLGRIDESGCEFTCLIYAEL